MPDFIVDYAPLRPPTEAYRDRAAAARWRNESFPETLRPRPYVRIVNLVGVPWMEVGALEELIGPVIRGNIAGVYGSFAIVIATSDGPVSNWVRATAAESGAPVFLANSVQDTPQAVRSSSGLTPAEAETLDVIQALGGRATAAELARARKLDPAAANNRLASLEKKRFLFRVARARPQGDQFIHPRSPTEGVPATSSTTGPSAIGLSVPDEIREAVFALAHEQGREPSDVLAEAWQSYFAKNEVALNEGVRRARDQQREQAETIDTEPDGLEEWARDAARRLREE